MALKKDHDFPDLLLGIPGISDHLAPFLPNSLNFFKPIRIRIDYLKGILSEMLDQAAGHYGANALYQSRSKIFLDPDG